MKLALVLAVSTLASCAALPATRSAEDSEPPSSNRLALYAGLRQFDEEDFDPVEDQGMLGIEFSHEGSGSGPGFEIGLMGSRDDGEFSGFDVEGRTGEIYGGLRKSFQLERVRPYIGGGLSYIDAEFDVGAVGEDDGSLAGYVHGGVAFDLGESFFLGIDVRWLMFSEIEIGGIEGDADYSQYALVLGFSL
jgi:opacity protein-like surface antigen